MTEQQQSDEQQHPTMTSAQQAMITPPLSPSIVGDAAALPAAESKKEDHSKFLVFLRLLMK